MNEASKPVPSARKLTKRATMMLACGVDNEEFFKK